MRTTVIVFFCLVTGALAALVHINTDLGSRGSYVIRDFTYDDIVFTTNQHFNNANGGAIEIYARSITIPSGITISARGSGGSGGGGGGGGGGRDGTDSAGDGGRGGSPRGENGSPGQYGGGHGAGGAGGRGGDGDTFDDDRHALKYPYSELVYKGNGGDGGAGGRGGGGKTRPSHDEEGAGGGGGGGGGNGGGCISLFAANRIFVGGRITSEGGAGGAGGSAGGRTGHVLVYGGDGGDGGAPGEAGGSGGKGRDGDSEDKTETNGGDGKDGLPGDILLACYSGDVEVHGALCAHTVKVFYGGMYENTSGDAGAATVWTNVYKYPTEWGYASDPEFLPIPKLYADQPECTTTATDSGDKYIVTAEYTNTFLLFSSSDVSSSSTPARGNGDPNVTFVTALRFEVPKDESGDTSTATFESGIQYASSYTNGITYSAGTPPVVAGQWWYMTDRNSSGWTYEQSSTPPSPVYYYQSGVAARGTSAGQSVCATMREMDTTTNYGPESITVTVNNSTREATVPVLTNFWLFPPTMLRYDDSEVISYSVTKVIVTNKWGVTNSYSKKMEGYRPRQSWQSDSTREWPMPNQKSGWQ